MEFGTKKGLRSLFEVSFVNQDTILVVNESHTFVIRLILSEAHASGQRDLKVLRHDSRIAQGQ